MDSNPFLKEIVRDIPEGTLFAKRYEIEGLLAHGGVGAIYRARQRPFKRLVALKIISTERSLIQTQFASEAVIISRLNHPNTVTVFDFGRAPTGELFIAMEYISGGSLAQRIAREGPLPVHIAVPIALQIAQSLQEAHTKGIIHRDLKPDNIMFQNVSGGQDVVKVVDFGIARILSNVIADDLKESLFGTPQYMAPEQFKSQDVDARADLYALGCCLFEMLTGALPFEADSIKELARHHLYSPPPHLPDHLPYNLNVFLQRVLSKQPEHRPVDAGTFCAELTMSLIDEPRNHSTQHTALTRSSPSYRESLPSAPIFNTHDSLPAASPSEAHTQHPSSDLFIVQPASSPTKETHLSRTHTPENLKLANAHTIPLSGPSPPSEDPEDVVLEDVVAPSDIVSAPPLQPVAVIRNTSTTIPSKSPKPFVFFAFGVVCCGVLSALLVVWMQRASQEVSIESEPPGALVKVDGVAVGRTPLTWTPKANTSSIGLEKEGYMVSKVNYTKGSDPRIYAPLTARNIQLVVASKCPRTEVFVEEMSLGILPNEEPKTWEVAWPERTLRVRGVCPQKGTYTQVFTRAMLSDSLRLTMPMEEFIR